jgi:thiamine-phosphate pyrophosphorylase
VADLGIGERRLYLCTADRPDLAEFVGACIDGGVDVVQLRDKVLDARPLLARAAVVQEVCATAAVPFVLNDRPDLALALGADGVHVGQDDAPPALARQLLGDDAIVGFSTHAPGELDGALAEPADYVSTGPVNETPTKPGRPGTGLDYLRYATARAGDLPFFVTGGVTPETLPAMLDAGARRFVVVRYLTAADDPAANAARLRKIIDTAW